MPWNISKHAQLNEEQVAALLKKELLSTSSVLKLFDQFEVDPSRLDDLQFEIADLEKKYAETDANRMVLNSHMFEGGWEAFKKKYFFVVAHEIVHWLSRVREEDSYFNDPEEVLGFVSSLAYEISQGTHPDEIWNKVYPKVSWHFQDEADAREFFSNMIEKAQKLISD